MASGDYSMYPHTTTSNPYNNHTYPLPEIGKNKYTPTLYSTEKLYINKPSKHKIPFQYHIPISPSNPSCTAKSSYPRKQSCRHVPSSVPFRRNNLKSQILTSNHVPSKYFKSRIRTRFCSENTTEFDSIHE